MHETQLARWSPVACCQHQESSRTQFLPPEIQKTLVHVTLGTLGSNCQKNVQKLKFKGQYV